MTGDVEVALVIDALSIGCSDLLGLLSRDSDLFLETGTLVTRSLRLLFVDDHHIYVQIVVISPIVVIDAFAPLLESPSVMSIISSLKFLVILILMIYLFFGRRLVYLADLKQILIESTTIVVNMVVIFNCSRCFWRFSLSRFATDDSQVIV